MKTKNLFTGTIKKCNNLYYYNQYGEEHYFGDMQIGKIQIGTIHRFVDVIDEKAVLIKVNEDEYIWLNTLTNKIDELFVNIGIPIKTINTISTIPYSENSLFVDKNTIEPIFLNTNDNLSVKKIKRLVPIKKEY